MIKIIMLCVFLMLGTTYTYAGTKIEKYKAFDGREFNSEKECVEYEEIEKKIIVILKAAGYGIEAFSPSYSYSYSLNSALRILLKELEAKNKKIIIQDISQ